MLDERTAAFPATIHHSCQDPREFSDMAKGKPSGGLPALEPGVIGQCAGKPVAFRIPRSMYRQLHEVVEADSSSPSKVMRDALAAYLASRTQQEAAAA